MPPSTAAKCLFWGEVSHSRTSLQVRAGEWEKALRKREMFLWRSDKAGKEYLLGIVQGAAGL